MPRLLHSTAVPCRLRLLCFLIAILADNRLLLTQYWKYFNGTRHRDGVWHRHYPAHTIRTRETNERKGWELAFRLIRMPFKARQQYIARRFCIIHRRERASSAVEHSLSVSICIHRHIPRRVTISLTVADFLACTATKEVGDSNFIVLCTPVLSAVDLFSITAEKKKK